MGHLVERHLVRLKSQYKHELYQYPSSKHIQRGNITEGSTVIACNDGRLFSIGAARDLTGIGNCQRDDCGLLESPSISDFRPQIITQNEEDDAVANHQSEEVGKELKSKIPEGGNKLTCSLTTWKNHNLAMDRGMRLSTS